MAGRRSFLGSMRSSRNVQVASKQTVQIKPSTERAQYRFCYVFADGTEETVKAPTPGDARSRLKKKRGGPLPKVLQKSRYLLTGNA